MKRLSDDNQRLQRSLQAAVSEALERKRRVGQYAVVWRDGQPAFIGPNSPASAGRYPTGPARQPGAVADADRRDT